jgi:hypothetical protein
MAHYDDLDNKQIFMVGAVSAVLTLVTILAVQVLYYAMVRRHVTAQDVEAEFLESRQIVAAQRDRLNQYGRHPQTGNLLIPIDRAISLVVEEQRPPEDNDQGEILPDEA